MSNPFENTSADYVVLMNEESQYSLWPVFASVPAGWTNVYQGKRWSCLDYINRNWTDMRPASLRPADLNTALSGKS
ncbi:MbtH family NRPS accessory protein [Paenibacillus sp. S150]|uniref:MbtH family protein n=1 Tax=Paenibacillus sp. S150 TaxID=2749826 RepID=UPI001C59C97A|nr:MbtH family NRPS accessory protein [Paenibacillus sp. S150]MBW4082992.1 MbtH family NRPS accessory protein [Paenibacillus sp. S150]